MRIRPYDDKKLLRRVVFLPLCRTASDDREGVTMSKAAKLQREAKIGQARHDGYLRGLRTAFSGPWQSTSQPRPRVRVDSGSLASDGQALARDAGRVVDVRR